MIGQRKCQIIPLKKHRPLLGFKSVTRYRKIVHILRLCTMQNCNALQTDRTYSSFVNHEQVYTMADNGRTQTKYMYNLSVTRYSFAWYINKVPVQSFCNALHFCMVQFLCMFLSHVHGR